MAEDTPLDTGQDGGGEGAPEPSLRDDVAAAFDQVESRETPADPAADGASARPAGSPSERSRGPDGRFLAEGADKGLQKPAGAPQPPAGPEGKPEGKQASAAPPRAPADAPAPAPNLRAPASWRPAVREHWAKLPPEVQQEVYRRETEVGRTLQESAQAREAVRTMQQLLAPFSATIQATGGDAFGAIQQFFQADHVLRHGSHSDKAQLVANIIKNYGVDIQALDSVLAGQAVQPDPHTAMRDQLRAELRRELQPVMGYFNQMQGRQREALGAMQAQAGQEVQHFGADAAHEFFEDVREDMADIIDLYTARGQQIGLQEAYERAIMLNPQVRDIVAKRAEAERVNAQAQAAQRARRAAASIGGSPAPAGVPGPAGDDRRAEIASAWDQASNG